MEFIFICLNISSFPNSLWYDFHSLLYFGCCIFVCSISPGVGFRTEWDALSSPKGNKTVFPTPLDFLFFKPWSSQYPLHAPGPLTLSPWEVLLDFYSFLHSVLSLKVLSLDPCAWKWFLFCFCSFPWKFDNSKSLLLFLLWVYDKVHCLQGRLLFFIFSPEPSVDLGNIYWVHDKCLILTCLHFIMFIIIVILAARSSFCLGCLFPTVSIMFMEKKPMKNLWFFINGVLWFYCKLSLPVWFSTELPPTSAR